MTVIAFRDGVLAADTATTFGCGMVRHDIPKIYEFKGRLAGAGGDAVDCAAFIRWFQSEFSSEPRCYPKPTEDDDSFEGLIVRPDGLLLIFTRGGWYPARPRYFAIGSGAQFAMGAMFQGATAEQAVRAGIELDHNSGGDVTILKVGG